jgi:hypothetical protein
MDTEEKVKEKFQWDAEGSLIGLLCSRNARPEKALVGRAQWETDSGYPPGSDTSELERNIIYCRPLSPVRLPASEQLTASH